MLSALIAGRSGAADQPGAADQAGLAPAAPEAAGQPKPDPNQANWARLEAEHRAAEGDYDGALQAQRQAEQAAHGVFRSGGGDR